MCVCVCVLGSARVWGMSLNAKDVARLSALLAEDEVGDCESSGFGSDNPFTVGLAHVEHMDGVLTRIKLEEHGEKQEVKQEEKRN